ncbi:MAG TPA: tetratricopeptide repeat-containing protein [bacterium]|nr:tetratricopeptide repeat-containing protein [bacterium]
MMESCRLAAIDDIARKLRDNEKQDRKAALLLGAGASRSAGIPLAAEIVMDNFDQYADRFPGFNRERLPDYASFVAGLDANQRAAVLDRYLSKARINMAHLYAACLVKHGLVDWILTTNFDSLAVRGLAFANVNHYVYDVANVGTIDPARAISPAVLHLHGQGGAFRTTQMIKEDRAARARLASVLYSVLDDRTLIVVGYGGENDPVFDILCRHGQHPHGLYWTLHGDAEPKSHVRDGLFGVDANLAYCVRNQDADLFFMRLARALGIECSAMTVEPFSYLRETLEQVAAVEETDLAEVGKHWAATAIDCFERNEAACPREDGKLPIERDTVVKQAREAWAEADTGALDYLLEQARKLDATDAFDPLGHAFDDWGVALADMARSQTGDEAVALFRDACARFERAAEVKPDLHRALYNWGNALYELARLQTGDDARTALGETCDKFRRATDIKPDQPEAFNTWGRALYESALLQTDDEARATFTEACDKFRRATELKPDIYTAFNYWGNALYDLGLLQTGDEARATFKEACARLQRATELRPDLHAAFDNWGNALFDLARLQTGDEVKATLREACDKYQRATEIKPDFHVAFNYWGNALYDLARLLSGGEAVATFKEACARFQRATEIKPDKYEAFNNWGRALYELAKQQTGDEARATFKDACARFQRATELKPDLHEAFNNWGNALYDLALFQTGDEVRATFEEACARFQSATEQRPDFDAAFNNWGSALAHLASFQTGDEARATLREACDKYQRATELKPDFHVAFSNWGVALGDLALLQTGGEARTTAGEAYARFQRAIEVKPDYYEALFNWACACAKAADKDKAFELLELLQDRAPALLRDARTDSDFNALHGDPRWQRLFSRPGSQSSP